MAANITWRTLEGAWTYATDPLLTSSGAQFSKNTKIIADNSDAYNISSFKAEVNFVAKHYYYTSFGFIFNFNNGVSGGFDTYFSIFNVRRYIYLKKHTSDGMETQLAKYYHRINLNTNALNKLTIYWNVEGLHRVRLVLNDSTPIFTLDNIDITDIGATGTFGLVAITDGNVIYDNLNVYLP